MSYIKIDDSDEENGGEVNAPVDNVPPLVYFNKHAESQNDCADQRPRKSGLNTNPNAEEQLEATPPKNEEEPKSAPQEQNKNNELIPIIVSENASNLSAIFHEACEEFLRSPEVKDLMEIITEERVRINYLLSLNSMPEINFSLYTMFEHLQLQFEARLNEYKRQKK